MKKYYVIFLLLTSLWSCNKSESVDADPVPSALIISAIKVFAGGNPSIKITYRLSNTSEVARTLIANFNYGFSGATNAELPTVDGEAIVYDHGNFNTSANYYFVFIMRDGSQIQTTITTFNF